MKTNTFSSLFKSDLYRLTHLKCVYVAPVIMLVMIIINYSLLWIESAYLGGAEIPEEIMGTLVTGRDLLFGAGSYIDIGLFMAIICGIFIGGEFATGTARLSIARGANRIEFYLSKWLVASLLATAYTLASFLVCGFLSAVSGGYGHVFDGAEFALLLRAIALQILIAIASTSVFVFLSFLTRTQGSTIGIAIAIYIIVSVVSEVVVLFATLNGNPALLKFATFTPSQQLSNASSYLPYTTSEILQVVLIPLAYIAVTLGIGLPVFIKRDVK